MALLEVEGLGTFVHPQYTYAAAWAYPRAIMRDWLRNRTGWNYTAGKIVRERAGWGWTMSHPLKPVTARNIVLCVACHAGRYRSERSGGHRTTERTTHACAPI